jgi:hypothetical protein
MGGVVVACLLAVLRPMVMFFQGTWFWHMGTIKFRGE